MPNILCPPYDVISPEYQDELYQKSDVNAVRLELPKARNPYLAAAQSFADWQSSQALVQDQNESIYPYHQHFQTADGQTHTRKGIIVACKLEPFSKGVVVPHEKTLSGPKKDRLSLFKETQANFSCIFGIYADPDKKVDHLIDSTIRNQQCLFAAADYQHSENQLWKIDDQPVVQAVMEGIRDKRIYIADGHHRYETGLAYANICRENNPNHTGLEPYNYIMMMLANMHDEGLIIFPTHRLVFDLKGFNPAEVLRKLETHFILSELQKEEELQGFLSQHSQQAFGLVTQKGLYGLALKSPINKVLPSGLSKEVKELDVTLLHQAILTDLLGISVEDQANQTHLKYSKDRDEVVEKVRSGKFQLGFVMNPTKIEEVISVSESGEVMPQKSTFFYPKVMTGMVYHSLK
jgi:uncharacterized protein (DUF1015 family)